MATPIETWEINGSLYFGRAEQILQLLEDEKSAPIHRGIREHFVQLHCADIHFIIISFLEVLGVGGFSLLWGHADDFQTSSLLQSSLVCANRSSCYQRSPSNPVHHPHWLLSELFPMHIFKTHLNYKPILQRLQDAVQTS